MKNKLKKWYNKHQVLLNNALVIIEKQLKLCFINITYYLVELIPHALIIDIKKIKLEYGISTGNHYRNKKAIVYKLGQLLPNRKLFLEKHNLLDLLILVHFYFTKLLLLKDIPEIENLPLFV